MTYQIAPRLRWSESITLAELIDLTPTPTPILEPDCTQSDAIFLQYEWTTRHRYTSLVDEPEYLTDEREQGTAWWSPSEQWWVYATGRVSNDFAELSSYEICLSSSGTLTSGELLQRLTDALDATTAIIPEYAAGLIEVFERIGIDLPSD